MKNLLLIPLILLLGGCASQAYYDQTYYDDKYHSSYSPGYERYPSTVVYYDDDWLDQPFWTLDPWYYPAAAYRNYSYGVSWVDYDRLYYNYYSYPVYGVSLYFSPIYSGWYSGRRHGYSTPVWHHGLRDFWWSRTYPYSTRHGSRRELDRLRQQGSIPPAAHRTHESAYRYRAQRYNSVRHSTGRQEDVRAVRGAYGREDGHRGRSSIHQPHAGERSMPFNSAVRRNSHAESRTLNRGVVVRRSTEPRQTSPVRHSAREELGRVGYAPGTQYAQPAQKPIQHRPYVRPVVKPVNRSLTRPVNRPENQTVNRAVAPVSRERNHTYRRPASTSRPVSQVRGERPAQVKPVQAARQVLDRKETRPSTRSGALPAARQRQQPDTGGYRMPMMKRSHAPYGERR